MSPVFLWVSSLPHPLGCVSLSLIAFESWLRAVFLKYTAPLFLFFNTYYGPTSTCIEISSRRARATLDRITELSHPTKYRCSFWKLTSHYRAEQEDSISIENANTLYVLRSHISYPIWTYIFSQSLHSEHSSPSLATFFDPDPWGSSSGSIPHPAHCYHRNPLFEKTHGSVLRTKLQQL